MRQLSNIEINEIHGGVNWSSAGTMLATSCIGIVGGGLAGFTYAYFTEDPYTAAGITIKFIALTGMGAFLGLGGGLGTGLSFLSKDSAAE